MSIGDAINGALARLVAKYAGIGVNVLTGEDFGIRDKSVNPPEGRFEVGTMRGYRGWVLHSEDDEHISLRPFTYTNQPWSEGINQAVHLNGSGPDAHAIECPYPTMKCTHGFYAYYSKRYWLSTPARPELAQFVRSDDSHFVDDEELLPTNVLRGGHHSTWFHIYGTIDAFGHMVRGSKGFRAEKAVITGLTLPIAYGSEFAAGKLESLLVEKLQATYPSIPIFKQPEEMFEALPLHDYDLDIDD